MPSGRVRRILGRHNELSRDEILIPEVLAAATELCAGRPADAERPLARARGVCEAMFGLGYEELPPNQELALENTRRIKAWRNLLHQLISGIPQISHKRESELAFELASFIDGLGIQVCLASSPAELKRSRKLAIEAVKNHLATIMRQQD